MELSEKYKLARTATGSGRRAYYAEDVEYVITQLEEENKGFREQLLLLKTHLGPDGKYAITRADGNSMSWENLVVSDIFVALDALLAVGGR